MKGWSTMSFLDRLFPRKAKQPVEPMHGWTPIQSEAEQDSTRKQMESEMAAGRQERSERMASAKNELKGSGQ